MIRPKVVCPLERHEEAIREAKRSKELDPLGLILNSICALVYCYACQYQTGEAEYRKAIELDPNFAFAHWTFGGLCLVSMEKYEEGIAELEKSIAMAENVVLPRGLLGYAYAKVGRRDNALRVVEELDKLAAHRYVTPMAKAFTYAGLGNERLFDALEDAY